jgi:hypothetical protein
MKKILFLLPFLASCGQDINQTVCSVQRTVYNKQYDIKKVGQPIIYTLNTQYSKLYHDNTVVLMDIYDSGTLEFIDSIKPIRYEQALKQKKIIERLN